MLFKNLALTLFILLIALTGCEKSQKPAQNPQTQKQLSALAAGGDLIVAKKTDQDIPLNPFSSLWQQAKEAKIPLVPQTAVKPRTPVSQNRELTVRVLYNDKDVGILLEWVDSERNETMAGVDSFADAAAVAFPMKYGAGQALPYIGMGHKGNPINIWHWKASWQADIDKGFQGVDETAKGQVPTVATTQNFSGEQAGSPLAKKKHKGPVENLLAEGFGTLTSTGEDALEGKGVFQDGRWHVVIKRRLGGSAESVALDRGGLVPVTFAVWDGAKKERNGMKGITRWRFLRFEKRDLAETYLNGLIIHKIPGADAARGEKLVKEAGCFQCHQFPGFPTASQVGPDLTYAGAIHRPEYLMESIKDPNAVVVPAPGYFNPKTGLSTMPSYTDVLEDEHYKDIVEYLRTLK